MLGVLICMAHLTVFYYFVMYAIQRESTLFCLNVKELLAGNWCDIWSLSDSNGTRTHNHVVRERTFNHLPKLANWLSCVMSTYLYGEFDCMLSCHVRDYPKGNFWSNTEKVTKFQLKLAILNIWTKFAQ